MADVAMPRLSDSMEEGTILKWLKSDGDEVTRGEELVEIETDKANMTYEADQAGPLEIVAQEGDTLPVGGTIARIGGGPATAGGGSEQESQAAGSEDGGGEEAEPAAEGGGTTTAEEPAGDDNGNGAAAQPTAPAPAAEEGG